MPLIVRLPTLRVEVAQVAELLATAHREGRAWGDMVIRCRHWSEMDLYAEVLAQRGHSHPVRKRPGPFDPGQDSTRL